MTEVEIRQGQNIIDIYFDGFASCLIIKKALAVNWPDCRGSVGEYYSISNYSVEERNAYTATLNNVLAKGNDLEQIDAVKPFLNLFANGKYSINKFIAKVEELEFLGSNQVVYSDYVPVNERFFGRFFSNWKGKYSPIIYSITNDKINSDRVEFYCQLIEKGYRPTVVTFEVFNVLSSEYSRSYVLDGHHKIQAYLKLKKDIPIINILKSEECVNKTERLLHFSKSILKDFEYKHLFENSENL